MPTSSDIEPGQLAARVEPRELTLERVRIRDQRRHVVLGRTACDHLTSRAPERREDMTDAGVVVGTHET